MKDFTRTYAVIHMDAVKENIKSVVSQVGKKTKIMAIVKANAYGHGAVQVANAIKDDVFGFAVATVKEAMELRNSGIDNMILILGYVCKDEYKTVISNNITFALLTKEMAADISECAKNMGLNAKCHVKINTGMNRIGFPVNDKSVDDLVEISKYPNLDCEGIFMHFATADEKNKDFSRSQYHKFMMLISALEERGVKYKIHHCANSAAIIDMPEFKLDMVREGIILYGLKPSDEVDDSFVLHPVMELKSHVIFVKTLAPGEGISYGRTYITESERKIATIAIGYADGYPRSLSSAGYVLIRGKRAPIVGRICMDQMMVDVTEIENVQVEDVVTLIGKDGDECITIEDMAKISGRFNYEFVCDISERVERKYEN